MVRVKERNRLLLEMRVNKLFMGWLKRAIAWLKSRVSQNRSTGVNILNVRITRNIVDALRSWCKVVYSLFDVRCFRVQE